MAEPDAIFKNGAYMNVNECQMYIIVYRYPPNISSVVNNVDHWDVVFEIL